jgi:hypothetical protein
MKCFICLKLTRSFFIRILLFSGFLVAGNTELRSSWKIWSSVGSEAMHVYAVAVDPQNPSILYVGTYGNGVMKSTDSGSGTEPIGSICAI